MTWFRKCTHLTVLATPLARKRVVAAVGGLTLAVTLAACGSSTSASSSNGNQPSGMGGMSGMDHGTMSTSGAPAGGAAAPTAMGRAGDIMFAQMMIPHHQQAVEMADLALTRAQSPRVRQLAEQIKAEQSPEIVTMNGWLTSWGASSSSEATTGMGGMTSQGGRMMSATDMAALTNASGASFDKRWLTMMIAHHNGAIAMAQNVLGTTSDPAVKQLANAVISSQTTEIAMMKGLLG